MVVVSDEVLAAAKERLIELSAKWKGGVTMGRGWNLDGSEIKGTNYTYCHAWVTATFNEVCGGNTEETYGKWHYWPALKGKEPKNFLTLSCHSKVRSKNICSPEAHEAIVLWVASEDCPLSKFILNRDDKESLINGGIVILCGPGAATTGQALWLCKVLRYGVEAGQALDVWHELVKGGVDPLFALYVATFVRTVKGASFGWTGMEGHSSVFYARTTEDLALLLDPRLDPSSDTTQGVFGGKSPGSYSSEDGKLRKFCKPVQKSDGWGGKVDGVGLAKEEFIDAILGWQKELGQIVKPKPKAKKRLAPTKDTVYLDVDM